MINPHDLKLVLCEITININFSITNPDYLRALFLKKGIDDMDVSRIFTLSLFLESPENYVRGLNLPKLPDNFEQLSPEELEGVLKEMVEATDPLAKEKLKAEFVRGFYGNEPHA